MKSVKPVKNSLRVWVASTSVAVFLGGWAILAHSPKPAPLVTTPVAAAAQDSVPTPFPTLAPVPSLNDFSQIQPLPSAPIQIQRSMPRFRTMGS